ncbi:hypothetical protein RHMOL_Rhmol09G0250000 [Rhododendron molle]|uniref:Uncharacterized protein n=1 Tax=Rhododendron molle TaxID=49168 RepID=A0ACC0MHN0_RHOML|nr:hypothetical protein RHMOL_Rhmol09G0250000 [Rhododendron molle]
MPSPPTPTTTTTSISPSSAACPIPPSPTVLISFCQFCCCCCCCCSLIRRRSRTEGSGGLEGSGRPPQPQLSRAFSSAANSIRVKTFTNQSKKYSVRPNNGFVLPCSTWNVIGIISGISLCTLLYFNKEAGNPVEDCQLRFVHVSPPKPSSPVPEESRKGVHLGLLNPKMDILKVSGEHVEVWDNSTEGYLFFCLDFGALCLYMHASLSFVLLLVSLVGEAVLHVFSFGIYVLANFQARALFLKLNKEKNNAAQQNNKLRQELELLKRGCAEGSSGIPLLFVVLIGFLGVIMGFQFLLAYRSVT